MIGRRGLVGVLGGVSAGIAGLVGAVSLTRIAGDFLGFPPGLEWTLTGAVDVAGIAGGIMWTAFRGRVRSIGIPMSIVCTTVSGIGVGLDHATHAARVVRDTGPALPGASPFAVWWWVAFAAGLFIPALFAWLLHALAVIGDQTSGTLRVAGLVASRDGWVPPPGDLPAPLPVDAPGVLPLDPAPAPAPASREHREDTGRDGTGTDTGTAGTGGDQREPTPGGGREDDRDPAVWAHEQDPIPGWRLIQREFPHLSESRARTAASLAKSRTSRTPLRSVQ